MVHPAFTQMPSRKHRTGTWLIGALALARTQSSANKYLGYL